MGREDMRKPAISAGNEAFSTGTGPRAGAQFSDNLRRGRRRGRRSFFMPWTAQEGGGAVGRMRGPRSPETLVNQPLQGRRAAPPAPEVSSSSRRKRAGFAAHGEIIADGPGKGKGRAVQTGALNVQKITAGVLKPPF